MYQEQLPFPLYQSLASAPRTTKCLHRRLAQCHPLVMVSRGESKMRAGTLCRLIVVCKPQYCWSGSLDLWEMCAPCTSCKCMPHCQGQRSGAHPPSPYSLSGAMGSLVQNPYSNQPAVPLTRNSTAHHSGTRSPVYCPWLFVVAATLFKHHLRQTIFDDCCRPVDLTQTSTPVAFRELCTPRSPQKQGGRLSPKHVLRYRRAQTPWVVSPR